MRDEEGYKKHETRFWFGARAEHALITLLPLASFLYYTTVLYVSKMFSMLVDLASEFTLVKDCAQSCTQSSSSLESLLFDASCRETPPLRTLPCFLGPVITPSAVIKRKETPRVQTNAGELTRWNSM